MGDDYNLNLFLVLTAQAGLLYLFIKNIIKPARVGVVPADDEAKAFLAKKLTVDLVLAIACAGKMMSILQLKVIKSYIEKDIAPRRILEKITYYLKVLFFYFVSADPDKSLGISKQICELTDFADRCDTLNLCMRVACANDIVTTKQLMLLKGIAEKFEIENERFQMMREKIIPVSKHEVKDIETILGITSDMDTEKTNSLLGKEYTKWNSRITNSNSQIRKQAQDMLEFIAKAKATNK